MNFFKKLVQRILPPQDVATEERRESVRLNFEVEIQVEWDGRSRPAKIVNLTFTGLCIEAGFALSEGRELLLKRDQVGPPFRGTVLWCKARENGRYIAGIECELDEEKLINSWLEPTLVEAGFLADYLNEKRTLVRVAGRLDCTLTGSAEEVLGSGKVADLSLGGALLEWPGDLKTGGDVSFSTEGLGKLDPLKGTATVASCRPGEGDIWLVGIQFKEVDSAQVRAYMTSLMKASSEGP